MTPSTKERWTDAWSNKRFRSTTIVLGILLPLTLLGFRRFLDFVELRQGAILADPLLSLYAPIDLTWITFVLIYSGLLFGLVILSSSPFLLLQTIAAYTILLFFRTVCMYTVPLDPPPGIIPLIDPFVELFGSSRTTLTRDLFFSGHTATLFLLGLGMTVRRWSVLLNCAAGAVAVCVLWQHVHYTIDVLVAPLAAFAAFRLATLICKSSIVD